MKLTTEKLACFLGEYRPICFDRKSIFGYKRVIEHADYAIFEKPMRSSAIAAALGNTVVKKISPVKFVLYPDIRCPFLRYKITLNDKTFPGLWKGSKLLMFLLLPYARIVKQDHYQNAQRLCVITDQGQIFHNYPARSRPYEGDSLSGDIALFEESVVWDLPGRLFPSPKHEHAKTERYFPNLPESCYVYHPMPCDNPGFRDVYGNGGFASSTLVKDEQGIEYSVSRFYQNSRSVQANSFHFMGGGGFSHKMNIIGTYRGNVDQGVRTCIFATDDGGRQWYCKYEFTDMGVYDFQQGHSESWGRNFGNPIRISSEEIKIAPKTISCCRRNIVLPTENNSIPVVSFAWEGCGRIVSINSKVNGPVELTFENPHNLKTGNIIALTADDRQMEDPRISWLLTQGLTAQSAGTGLLFKVEVVDVNSVRLYELVSAQEPMLPCRHIHHVNRIRDGWTIGTGEIYPNSWVLYMQMKEADTYSVVHASDYLPIYRLNTSMKSLQRTMGVLITDESEPRIIYASDHDISDRENVPGNCFSRNSTGVYCGKLCDLDDRNKLTCVFEAEQPSFYFQNLDGMLLFIGQRGEIGVCTDPTMKKWTRDHLQKISIHYMGCWKQCYFFDNFIIVRK